MSIALPTIQRSLHFTEVDRQWVVTAYALAFGSLLLLGGRLADLLGRKETLLVGLVGFAGVSAVGGAKWDSSDPWVRDSAADRRAGGGAFGPGAGAPPVSHRAPWAEMAGFAGGVQSFSGEAAGEMLESLFGPGGDMTGSHGRPARRRA